MKLKNLRAFAAGAILFGSVFFFAAATTARAQPETDDSLKIKAETLFKQGKYIEALPLLESLAIAAPDDANVHFQLGAALLAKTRVATDKEEIRQLFVRARKAFLRAKQLDHPEPKLDAFIQSIPENGAVPGYAENAEVERLMKEGEAAFAQGKMDEAFGKYKKALEADPKLYHAALYAGDTFVQRGDYANAEIWYQKAIQIDPWRETAYRYSATPLMRQKKYEQARARYVEAYIAEPFNNYAVGGLTQWAQATGARLGHPAIEIPTAFAADEKGDAKITLDANTLLNGKKDDGSSAWLIYGATRAAWQKDFVKKFPNERTYRHSLAEELDALQSVLKLAATDKKAKNLSPSLALLKELNDKGLLEAYILLARADQGIYQDYAAYLKANREKLRRYVAEYIIGGGGK